MTEYLNDVTPDQAIATLRDVVNGREDYVYSAPAHQESPGATCFYVHTDAETGESYPGCVAGHVLNRLGVPLSLLEVYEQTRVSTVVNSLAETPERHVPENVAYLGHILDRAQQCQDTGGTWGESLRRAEGVDQPA